MNKRVLVIGTTPDYVDIICKRFPNRAVFLTDERFREKAKEKKPDVNIELQYDLTQHQKAKAVFVKYLDQWEIDPSGVACFDCESMLLAADIAKSLSLPYPSSQSIAACRSKLVTKQIWQKKGLPCPESELVQNISDVERFIDRIQKPIVLKPLTGSGSELTFLCNSKTEIHAAFDTIKSRLAKHPDVRMYAVCEGQNIDPKKVFLVEEFVLGCEYSCDFVIEKDRLDIIRIAKKIHAKDQSFGTTLAYEVPSHLPSGILDKDFQRQLRMAALSLGIQRAMCMLDFIVENNRLVMLEISPRPAGDCLPPLLLKSSGFDILKSALDFAEQKEFAIPKFEHWRHLIGLRLFANRDGYIDQIDSQHICKDSRVLECFLIRGPGHKVVLPPNNYDSRVLGYAIFEPTKSDNIWEECIEITNKLKVEYRES